MKGIHKKPLSKKEWKFWEDRLGAFIEDFASTVLYPSREAIKLEEANSTDFHNVGIENGMRAIYDWVEERMVEEDSDDIERRSKK